jgi:hypothetical protein
MQGEVPLCKDCSDSRNASKKAANGKQRRGKKQDSDDEGDEPMFPPWIMKVITFLLAFRVLILKWCCSRTSHFLVKS